MSNILSGLIIKFQRKVSNEQTPPEQEALELAEIPKTKKKAGRTPFAKNLPRVQVFVYLSDEEKTGAINTFFVKVHEALDIYSNQSTNTQILKYSNTQILKYIQERATFKDVQGNSTIKMASVTKNPIPKAMGSVNLMSLSLFQNTLMVYRFID